MDTFNVSFILYRIKETYTTYPGYLLSTLGVTSSVILEIAMNNNNELLVSLSTAFI